MDAKEMLHSLMFSDLHSLGFWDVVFACLIPFILAFPLCWVYKKTQKHSLYAVSFLHSLFLFASLSSVVTLIIGGNIARAFGLVGALSIVRFRNALKSPVDTMYIFWALVLGMACGSGYYMAATTFVFILSFLSYLLFRFRVGGEPFRSLALKLVLSKEHEAEAAESLRQMLGEKRIQYKEMNRVFESTSNNFVLMYMLSMRDEKLMSTLESELKKIKGVEHLSFSSSQSSAFFS